MTGVDDVNIGVQGDRMAYHHGDARAALLQAAGELIERDGAACLSLRQVAERAGLSRQAPYNHFADKKALLADLVRDGFDRLRADIATDESVAAPSVRLAEAAERYIAFGQDRPALFRLMFGKELVDVSLYPHARDAAEAALAQLSAIIVAMSPARDAGEASLVAWSLVHGYTSLCIETGLEPPERREGRAKLFADRIVAFLRPDG